VTLSDYKITLGKGLGVRSHARIGPEGRVTLSDYKITLGKGLEGLVQDHPRQGLVWRVWYKITLGKGLQGFLQGLEGLERVWEITLGKGLGFRFGVSGFGRSPSARVWWRGLGDHPRQGFGGFGGGLGDHPRQGFGGDCRGRY